MGHHFGVCDLKLKARVKKNIDKFHSVYDKKWSSNQLDVINEREYETKSMQGWLPHTEQLVSVLFTNAWNATLWNWIICSKLFGGLEFSIIQEKLPHL